MSKRKISCDCGWNRWIDQDVDDVAVFADHHASGEHVLPTLNRLYRAVLATAPAHIADAHPDDPADYELAEAIMEAERTLGIA